MVENIYDVMVIGGGPAGLTASIYASRKKMKTLLITVNMGGQATMTSHIENYPGFSSISGIELARLMEEQMKNFSAETVFGKAVFASKEGDLFALQLASGEKYFSKSLILAFGKVPRSLGIPGEDRFAGRGISSCAVCDGPMFRDKNVIVIGGGNSALEAAEIAARFASKVYLMHRRDVFTGDESTLERVKSNQKIEMMVNSFPTEVLGEKFMTGVVFQDSVTNEKKELGADGMFVEIGYETKTDWIKSLVSTNELGEIVVNEKCETSVPGIFAAGDVTNGPYKQLVIAAGQGAISALSAYSYLQKISGSDQPKTDWGKTHK